MNKFEEGLIPEKDHQTFYVDYSTQEIRFSILIFAAFSPVFYSFHYS